MTRWTNSIWNYSAHQDACLAPFQAIANNGGFDVNTDNVMSYYYYIANVITGQQASLTRANAFARGFRR